MNPMRKRKHSNNNLISKIGDNQQKVPHHARKIMYHKDKTLWPFCSMNRERNVVCSYHNSTIERIWRLLRDGGCAELDSEKPLGCALEDAWHCHQNRFLAMMAIIYLLLHLLCLKSAKNSTRSGWPANGKSRSGS